MPQRPSFRRALVALAIGLLSVLGEVGAMQAQGDAEKRAYVVIDLGVLEGDDFSAANAVNADGVVVGESGSTETYLTRATLYRQDTLTAIPGGDETGSSSAADINASGAITGYVASESRPAQAVLWVDGEATLLGTLGGDESYALGVNDENQVVGWSLAQAGTYDRHAFFWDGEEMTDLGVLAEGLNSIALDLNNAGQIVGSSTTAPDSVSAAAPEHAVLWEDGKATDLGTIAGNYSVALAINDDGLIVGSSTTGRGQLIFGEGMHAVLWEDGVPTDLGTLEKGNRSSAAAINNEGLIVGSSSLERGESTGQPGEEHACLWVEGEIYDLNELIPRDGGWTLERAHDINDAGHIVGVGLRDGERRAFLLIPEE